MDMDNLNGIMANIIMENGKKAKKHGSGMWSSKKGDTYIGEWNLGKV
jgi:hypothetical protein